MTERVKELRSILIEVLVGLGVSKVRITVIMAIIAAHKIEEEMARWMATFYGRSDSLTVQALMSKIQELTEGRNSNLVRFGGYYEHPERYNKAYDTDEESVEPS